MSSASTWGSHICSNIASGISNAIYKVKDAASSIARSIKSFLGFSEPETGPLSDFHTYMPDMLKLMASGIEQSKGVALRAVSGVASAISDEIQNGDYTIKPIAAGELGSAITDGGDRIVESFSAVLDRLQSLADRITFSMPTVAMAGVVPYSVAAPSRTSNAGSSSNDRGMEELFSVLTQLINNQTRALVAALEQTGNTRGIDAKNLTAGVITELRRQARVTGKPLGV